MTEAFTYWLVVNWLGIVAGAVAGLVAALISWGIMKSLGWSGSIFLHIFVFVGVALVARTQAQPLIEAQRIDITLRRTPAVQAIKEHEPDAYRRIEAVVAQGRATGMEREQILAAVRNIVSEVAESRLPQADDETLLKFGRHVVSVATALQAKDADMCTSHYQEPDFVPADYSILVGPELAQQEIALEAAVVISAAGKSRPPIPLDEVDVDLKQVVGELVTLHGADSLDVLTDPDSPEVDRTTYCPVLADMYKEVLRLPAPRNSRLLRYLLQEE